MPRNGMEAVVRAMGPEERREMLRLLLEAIAQELPGTDDGRRPGRCPRCGCEHVVRRGHEADGAQRWLCRGCGGSFGASSCRVLGTTRLSRGRWDRYASLMLAGAILREAAEECGVSLKTSFSMRHRLCEVMASMLPGLEAGPAAGRGPTRPTCPTRSPATPRRASPSTRGSPPRGAAPRPTT